MTLDEIARRIGMQPWYDQSGGEATIHEWIDPHSTTANRPIPHSRLRIYLLTGDRPLRIAAKVLRAPGFCYDLDSLNDVLGIRVFRSGEGCVYVNYSHPDEATAILAAAEALPSDEARRRAEGE
jgi:hypothetical protein